MPSRRQTANPMLKHDRRSMPAMATRRRRLVLGALLLSCALAPVAAGNLLVDGEPNPAPPASWQANTGETKAQPRVLQPVSAVASTVKRPTILDSAVTPCQALGPASPWCVWGIDSVAAGGCGELNWQQARAYYWQAYAQGEYVGHFRTQHVGEYRLRVDDQLEVVYRLTRDESAGPYELNVGDEVRVESFTDPTLNGDSVIQPDGSITLRLLGQVRASKRSVAQLREEIEERYRQYYPDPAITVIPLKVNTKLEDIRATVDSRQGLGGGQFRAARVTPEGTIQLPAIGNVPAQGLTLDELKLELDYRYAQEVDGLELTPVLVQRAPRFVYVVGEVGSPGRFSLEGPTTTMQAIALAGGWTVGANLRQVIVFRRGDDWRLMATMLDLRGALYGRRPTPADEIWLSDSDIVVVPKQPIKVIDEAIDLVFTQGIYGVLPMQGVSLNFAKLSSL